MANQADIISFLRQRGWHEGAGGSLYFPQNHPHLHIQIKHGNHDYAKLIEWVNFLALSRGRGTGSIKIAEDGRTVGKGADNLAQIGAKYEEARAICTLDAPG